MVQPEKVVVVLSKRCGSLRAKTALLCHETGHRIPRHEARDHPVDGRGDEECERICEELSPKVASHAISRSTSVAPRNAPPPEVAREEGLCVSLRLLGGRHCRDLGEHENGSHVPVAIPRRR